jgi:hypothetical protein
MYQASGGVVNQQLVEDEVGGGAATGDVTEDNKVQFGSQWCKLKLIFQTDSSGF